MHLYDRFSGKWSKSPNKLTDTYHFMLEKGQGEVQAWDQSEGLVEGSEMKGSKNQGLEKLKVKNFKVEKFRVNKVRLQIRPHHKGKTFQVMLTMTQTFLLHDFDRFIRI